MSHQMYPSMGVTSPAAYQAIVNWNLRFWSLFQEEIRDTLLGSNSKSGSVHVLIHTRSQI